MSEKYSNGKIYCIKSPNTDKYYIGSTCQELDDRFYGHLKCYKYYIIDKNKAYVTSYEILKYESSYIELIELYSCSSKAELEKREGEIMIQHKPNIVNNHISGRGKKEVNRAYHESHKEQSKQYYQINKEKILNYQKQYYKSNKSNKLIQII